VAASAAIVGTTTSPQFRESPETAKVQVAVVGCNVPPDCASGVSTSLRFLRYEKATEATTMPTSKHELTIITSLTFLDIESPYALSRALKLQLYYCPYRKLDLGKKGEAK
jgi:hypothetical protein